MVTFVSVVGRGVKPRDARGCGRGRARAYSRTMSGADDIVRRRLSAQGLVTPSFASAPDVVRSFGAVQAQDYRASLWGIALRTRSAAEVDVERAIAERSIVRTWPMRFTLHFVPAEDARWMLRLLTPRIVKRSAGRHRQLDLDEAVFAKSRQILERALRGGKLVTRAEAFALLGRAKIATAAQRGIHILARLAMDGVLCFGAHRGKQPTFALLDEWIPRSRELDRDEALGELARRYFNSHGPATEHDFAWWSGLPLGPVRIALAVAKADLAERTIDGRRYYEAHEVPSRRRRSSLVHLLPPFDEYTVAYRDRSAFLAPAHRARTQHGLTGVVAIDGRIEGTWKREARKEQVAITVELVAKQSATAVRALEAVAARYGRFLGLPASIEIASG